MLVTARLPRLTAPPSGYWRNHVRTFSPALRLTAALAAFAATPCAKAQTATFTVKPIKISGNTNFQATAINGSGSIVGILYDSTAGTQTAMEIIGGTATPLANPGGSFGPFFPSQINDGGAVLGYASNSGIGNTIMFLLQSGVFNTAYEAPLVEPGDASGAPPLPLGLTDNLKVSFNTIYSISGPIGTSYGLPPHYHTVPPQNRYTHVNSVNASAMVAGTSYSLNGITAVYTGKDKAITTIMPPNAKSVYGGYINDANTVAGSFEDNSGAWHGFTYAAGTVTTFDMPQASTKVTVNAINRRGRVVGIYADSKGEQHGFQWNGTTVATFGNYLKGAGVAAAIGNKGKIVIWSASPGAAEVFHSFLVVCHGTGC